jgi:uncharacterized protein
MTDSCQKILLSGASGLIGANLVRFLAAKRIQTFQLVRTAIDGPKSGRVVWDPAADRPVADVGQLEGMDAAIHLSGANISFHRWTESYKREIASSRVDTTRALVRIFGAMKQPPKTFLCASATGIYGHRGEELLTEASAPGRGFLANTCVAWEAAADSARETGARVVQLRFGVGLSPEGGALKRMLPIFRLGVGGRLGSGRQWMSWISLTDQVRAIAHILETETLDGPVNLVAPNPVTNAEFTRALGRAVHRPAVLPVPAPVLRMAIGEMADEALLASERVVPERLLKSGFRFEHPDIATALRALL